MFYESLRLYQGLTNFFLKEKKGYNNSKIAVSNFCSKKAKQTSKEVCFILLK